MKPDLNYERDIFTYQIQAYLSCLEDELRFRKPNDPLFEQFSIEKFTMERLLEEFDKRKDIPSAEIVHEFGIKLYQTVRDGYDQDEIFSTSYDAIQLIMESLYVD